LAKSMSVKSGDLLNHSEQQHIINALFACKDPLVSPFGKVIYSSISQTDLDLKFI